MILRLLLLAVPFLQAPAEAPVPTPEGLAADVARPKLLLVDVDDLGWEFLREHPQPFFDRLDREGRRYERFFATPLCTPTRSAMQLGAYGSHPDHLCGGLIAESTTFRMPVDGPLEPLAKVLVAEGHSTAKVGKWHLATWTDVAHPTQAGWQRYVGSPGNPGGTEPYFRARVITDDVAERGVELYLTSFETDRALEFVEQDVELVSVSYHAIHDPYHLPPQHLHSVEEPVDDADLARAMLEALANELDRLWTAAEARGYTLVLFSDNGGLAPLGGAKGALNDRGTNVPLWVAGPGVERGVDPSMISVVDLYRTTLDFFGVEASATRGPDSRSFHGTWSGEPGGREWIYLERFDDNGVDPRERPELWARAVRGPRFLYVRALEGPPERLYDYDGEGDARNLLNRQLNEAERAAYDRLRAVLEGL